MTNTPKNHPNHPNIPSPTLTNTNNPNNPNIKPSNSSKNVRVKAQKLGYVRVCGGHGGIPPSLSCVPSNCDKWSISKGTGYDSCPWCDDFLRQAPAPDSMRDPPAPSGWWCATCQKLWSEADMINALDFEEAWEMSNSGTKPQVCPVLGLPQSPGSPETPLQDGQEAAPAAGGEGLHPPSDRQHTPPLTEGLLLVREAQTGRKHVVFDFEPYSGQREYSLTWRHGDKDTFRLEVNFPYDALVRVCAPCRVRRKLLEDWKP